MFSQLTTSQSRRKLSDYQTIVAKKRRLKEESQRRKDVNTLPSLSARRPLRPSNLNVTVTKKPRKSSLDLAVSPNIKLLHKFELFPLLINVMNTALSYIYLQIPL